MSNDQLTSENLDDETLAELIEFRRTTLKHHTDKENKTQAILHNMVLVALLELQERRKPQRPVAFLNDAHLNRGYVEGGVTSDDDAPGMIPVYREPVGVVYVSCLPESEFDELQERRKADSAEPIGWTDAEELRSVEKDGCGYLFKANPISPNADPRRVIKLYRHAQPAPVMNDDLYKLANHVASSKNGLPEEWQDWAEELENEIRRAAMLQGKVDDEVGSWNNHKNTPTPTAKPVSEPYKVLPTVSFYRDGIDAAANWVDQQRESYDSEHGRQDNDTGSFEFGNDAQRDYSDTLAEIAEGIRALHPNAGIPPAPVMPDSANGLMPCPFCGGKARQLTIEQDNDPHFGGDVITCTECGVSSHVEFGFKENLKSAWNSRAFMLQFGNSPVSPGIWTEKVLDTNKDNRESEDADHE